MCVLIESEDSYTPVLTAAEKKTSPPLPVTTQERSDLASSATEEEALLLLSLRTQEEASTPQSPPTNEGASSLLPSETLREDLFVSAPVLTSNEEVSTVSSSPEKEVPPSSTFTALPTATLDSSEEVVKLSALVEKLVKQEVALKTEKARLQTQNRRLQEKLADIESGVSACLTKDQVRAVGNKSGRVKKWSKETLKKGLSISLLTSSTGYQVISKKFFPFPSDRTLRRKTEHVRFKPGILTEIFHMTDSFKDMSEEDFNCVMGFDDMAIQPAL